MVEVFSCIKDSELAHQHIQHNMEIETQELGSILESMTLDRDRGKAIFLMCYLYLSLFLFDVVD